MITFYVHHDGRGHVDRTLALIDAIDRQTAVMTSAPLSPSELPDRATLVPLPPDVPDPVRGDVTARRTLHWAPQDLAVGTTRAAAIVAHLRDARPALVVVDVSVEVVVQCRLVGARVVAVRLPGPRDDPPHRLAFTMADAVLAPFPAILEDSAVPRWLVARSHHSGLIPRRPVAPVPPVASRDGRRGRVLVLWGRGTPPPTIAELDAATAATPGWRWVFAGPALAGPSPRVEHLGWLGDVRAAIADADVVVGPASNGVAAVVLGTGRPYVAIPGARPFAEQESKAAMLAAHGMAVVVATWPPGDRWPELLHQAETVTGGYDRAGVAGAAVRTARWLEAVADAPCTGLAQPV